MLFDKLKDTQLKSLKYGDDRPGGVNSLEPIISKPILDGNTIGIIPTFNGKAAENKARISALLKSTPRGLNFVSTQAGLQLSNTRLELSSGPTLNRFGTNGGFGTEIAKILNSSIDAANTALGVYNKTANRLFRSTELLPYNPDNTISQVGALQGEHLDRFGLTPYINDNLKYINIAKSNNSGINSSNNRLASLRSKFNLGVNSTGGNIIGGLKAKLKTLLGGVTSLANTATSVANIFGGNPLLNQINNKINQISRIAVPFLEPLIDQYIGGPGSINGLGVTNIRRFDSTNTDATINAKASSTAKFKSIKGRDNGLLNQPKANYAGATPIYNDLTNLKLVVRLPQSLVGNTFDKLKAQQAKTQKSYGGASVSVDGKITEYAYSYKERSYKNIEDLGFDKNTTTHIPTFSNYGKLDDNTNNFDRDDAENMSIVFQLINPFTAQNLHRIIFPAYINNFKVNTDATWNDVSYIGRSENLYVYTKFKRQVSFGFQIPCFNIVQLRERHRALGALESSLAGQYSGHKLGGILTKLYFGNYLKGETGIINSISYDIPNESSWDIDSKLAHNINVSVNFTVIGNALPTYKREGGFFNAIANGADYFTSSELALNNTGANDDAGLKKYTKFTKVVKRKEVSSLRKPGTLSAIGANDSTQEDKNAELGAAIGSSYGDITGDEALKRFNDEENYQILASAQGEYEAMQAVQSKLTLDSLRLAQGNYEVESAAQRAKAAALQILNDNMTEQYRQIIENASQYGATNNNI
jgi:hypothetical protein